MFKPNSTTLEIAELSAYRPFDAAPTSIIDESTRIRAQAAKEQIMATDPGSPHAVRVRSMAPNQTRALRLAAIPIAAAAVIGIGIAIPGGRGIAPAQANINTWTATSTPLTGDGLARADEACRTIFGDHAAIDGLLPDAENSGSGAIPVISDQRDDWGLVGYPLTDGGIATCLVWLGGESPEVLNWTTPYSTGFTLLVGGAEQWGGFFDTEEVTEPAATGIDLRASQQVRFGADALVTPPASGSLTIVGGKAGSDIAELTLQTLTSGPVEATITDGYWLAWWPDEMGGAERFGVANDATVFTVPGGEIAAGYSATLADGTTMNASLDWAGPCTAENNCYLTVAEAEAAANYLRANPIDPVAAALERTESEFVRGVIGDGIVESDELQDAIARTEQCFRENGVDAEYEQFATGMALSIPSGQTRAQREAMNQCEDAWMGEIWNLYYGLE